jgi:Arc/MetJ family transcription regulator
VTKRLVDIDDDLLERARTACGERTIRATVEAGLQALADRASGVQHIRFLRQTEFDLEAFEEARNPRSAPP